VIAALRDGVAIKVRVIPRAARSSVAGTRGGRLLVRLHAPPIEGAANAALVEVLADALGVPARAVSIASGRRSREKEIRVEGVRLADARSRLGLSP
jgi:uncharacterized protein (TIGR00251 family)